MCMINLVFTLDWNWVQCEKDCYVIEVIETKLKYMLYDYLGKKNLWHCISQSQYFFKEKVCVCARTCVFVCLCDFAIHIVWHSSIILNRVSLALSLQYSVIPLHFSDGGFVKLLWTEVLYLSIGPTTVAQQCATPIFSLPFLSDGRLIEQQSSFISLWLTWSILHWMTMHYHIHSHSWGIHWYHFTLLSSTKPDI